MSTTPEVIEAIGASSPEDALLYPADQLLVGVNPEIIEILGAEEVIKLEALSHDLEWIDGVVTAENPFSKPRTGEPDLSFMKPKKADRIMEAYEAGLTPEKFLGRIASNPLLNFATSVTHIRLTNLGDAARVALRGRIDEIGDQVKEVSHSAQEVISDNLDGRMPVDQVVELSEQMSVLREYANQLPTDGTFEAIRSVLETAGAIMRAKSLYLKQQNLSPPRRVRTVLAKETEVVNRKLANLDKTQDYHIATLRYSASTYEVLREKMSGQKIMFALDLLNAAAGTKISLEEASGGLDESQAGPSLLAEKYVLGKIAEAEKALREVDPQILNSRAAAGELRRLQTPKLSQAEQDRVAREEEAVSRDLSIRVTLAKEILRGGGRLEARNGDNPSEITEKLKQLFKETGLVDTEIRHYEAGGLIISMLTGKFDTFARTLAELKSEEDASGAVAIVTRNREAIVKELREFDIDDSMHIIRSLIGNPEHIEAIKAALTPDQLMKLERAIEQYFEERE